MLILIKNNFRFFVVLINLILLIFWIHFPTDETSGYMLVLVPALILFNIGGLMDVFGVIKKRRNWLELFTAGMIFFELYLILY